MKYFYTLSFLFFASFFIVHTAEASHLRAGEITAERDPQNPLRYRFRLTTYTDNVGGMDANKTQEDVIFFFGDEDKFKPVGTIVRRLNQPEGTPIGNETNVNYYDVWHTFPGNGVYTIRVGIPNRNKNVINLGRDSDQISFYVATTILVNAQLGFNHTPVPTYPPIDQACVGQRFIHNPKVEDYDKDDVITYELFQPWELQNPEKSDGIGIPISGYEDPATGPDFLGGRNEDKTAPASFRIDNQTGDLVWDAPAKAGEYNVAFKIIEKRNGIVISVTIRDMQIIVKDCNNQRPRLFIPNDTCVVAGDSLTNVVIRATDRDNDPITISSSSPTSDEIYGPGFPLPWARFKPNTPQPNPASGRFDWKTSCDHIRQQPYAVLFKAEDNPPAPEDKNKLVDLKIWRITVVGPKPENFQAKAAADAKSVVLSWKSYACQKPGAQLLIWRKVGCGYTPGPCERGLAASSGYTVIGQVPASATSFTDNNQGQGLARGINYSYRISVNFAPPAGGASLASDEVCIDIQLRMPVITHVTVDTTNRTGGARNGVITVRWTRPAELDTALFPGPYGYQVFRAAEPNSNAYVRASDVIPAHLDGTVADTVFVDKNLDTRNTVYRYQIAFYYKKLLQLDTTSAANSVRLEASPAINAVDISWQARVPWSNENQPHIVYRESRRNPGVFNQIAEVAVQGSATFRYQDDGVDRFPADGTETIKLSSDTVYCYQVKTVGSYGNPRIKPALLMNYSQEICASPRDTVRPCTPVLRIDTLICREGANNCTAPYTNQLTWTYPQQDAQGLACKEPIKYKLYYTRYEGEPFSLLTTIVGTPPAQAFTHAGLPSYAGCYYVTAVARSGTESLPSNIVCKDNCPYYELPNVFTPNSDGENDLFEPFDCPRFVESVNFTVYNRWGVKVFERNNNIFIHWDGRLNTGLDTQGKELSSSVYYYIAKVKYQRLRRQDETEIIKGWVQILK